MVRPCDGWREERRARDVTAMARSRPRIPLGTGSERGLSGWLGVREGEGRTAWTLFGAFLLLETCHYIGKAVRQATYIESLGAERLPWVYLLLTATAVPVLLLYARLARGRSLHRLIVLSCLVQGVGLVVFYGLFARPSGWVALAFYLWITTAFGIAISQFWLYSASVFDPRQARRLFSFICAGGLLGGLTGGQLTRLTADLLGTRASLLVAAALMLVLAAGLGRWRLAPEAPAPEQRPAQAEASIEDARGGLAAVRGSRLLLLIAAVMFLTMVVSQVVDVQFNWAVERTTIGLDRRAALFGNFFSVMGLFAFVFQLVATRWIHRALGVGFAMRVMPVTVAMGSLLLLATAGLGPSALLAAGAFLKLGESGLRHSLDQSTRELLFFPVPADLRRRAKASLDVFVQRFAEGCSAIFLLTVTFGLIPVQHLSWLTLALVAVWLPLTVATRREYVRSFREGLSAGSVDSAATIDLEDVTTVTTLVEFLGSPDPRQVISSIDLLALHGRGRLVPPLLLYHDDPTVRLRTLEVLTRLGRSDAVGLIERCLADVEPEVRSAAIRTLAALQGRDACELMAPRIGDPDPRVRAAAVVCLARYAPPELAARADAALTGMLVDGKPAVRSEACRALGQLAMPSHQDELVQALYDRDGQVVREAIAAVRRRTQRDGPNPVYLPILISLLRDRRLKHDARLALEAYGAHAIDALVLFMQESGERIWVRRAAPKAIARIGGPTAAEALVGALGAHDTVLRRKVVEALVYLRTRDPHLELDSAVIETAMSDDVRGYLRALADLAAIGAGPNDTDGPAPAVDPVADPLLVQLLRQAMAHRLANLFGLLELLHPAADVRAAHRSLVSGDRTLRAHALEFLDNTLSGRERRDLFAVIDEVPASWKLRQAGPERGIVPSTRRDTILRLISADVGDNPAAAEMALAALHLVWERRDLELAPAIAELARRTDQPEVEAAAVWVSGQLSEGSQMTGREPRMTAMARIEMVVFLRAIDLFAACTAEQVLQLAAIATERSVAAGTRVYRAGDPSETLFCVIEGRVELSASEPGRSSTAGPREAFGVFDILSGRLHRGDAVASESTRLLAIDADDFFDLLSSNIEIVKALFRTVTSKLGAEAAAETLR